MSRDIGIDLGTATVLVYVKGKGIVLEEPSVVAIDKLTDKVICVGREAQQMQGRTPPNIEVVRPLRDGVISRYEVTLQMLRHFLAKACGGTLFRPRIMVCIPSGITEVEERAVNDAALQAGARKTYLIEEPVAAALGADIDISMPNGNLIVDIGGGTTDIALISLDNPVVTESIKVGGDKFDDAIIRYIRRKYGVLIGERTAEDVKLHIGSACPRAEEKYMDVKGRCLSQGLPKAIRIQVGKRVLELSECPARVIQRLFIGCALVRYGVLNKRIHAVASVVLPVVQFSVRSRDDLQRLAPFCRQMASDGVDILHDRIGRGKHGCVDPLENILFAAYMHQKRAVDMPLSKRQYLADVPVFKKRFADPSVLLHLCVLLCWIAVGMKEVNHLCNKVY